MCPWLSNNPNGVRRCNGADKAEALSAQFGSVFTVDDGMIPEFRKRTNVEIGHIVCVSEDVVQTELKRLPSKTSSGPDAILPWKIEQMPPRNQWVIGNSGSYL